MEQILLAFINTLDQSFKQLQERAGIAAGLRGLTIHQTQYIDAIHMLGEPTITEVANQLKITKASVTAGVNKLVDLGYVTKTQSSADKRVVHVRLTADGERLIAAKLQALHEYGAFIRAALSEAEARQFEATLAKLVKVFQDAEHMGETSC